MMRAMDFDIYLITDRSQTRGRSIVDVVEASLEGGVRCIQLREKDLSGRELYDLAKRLRELTHRYNARLFVNDRVDVALMVGADGVHLGQRSFSPSDVRPYLGQDMLIGVSTHSLEEALEAQRSGADFITIGPVYYTPSKASYGKPPGPSIIKRVKEAVDIAVFALGGIKLEHIGEVITYGADGISLISAIMGADDVKKATEDILNELSIQKQRRVKV